MSEPRLRNPVVVLGDQLDPDGAAFDGFDDASDAVLMSEVDEEASYVPQHRQRLVRFFAAMRHMRDALRGKGRTVLYGTLAGGRDTGTLAGELERTVKARSQQRVVLTEPGDHRVLDSLRAAARKLDMPFEVRRDRHFMDTVDGFTRHGDGRRELVLETYYRRMPHHHALLKLPVAQPRPAGEQPAHGLPARQPGPQDRR